MAFMSQAKKKELAPKIKSVCAKYGVKCTIGVHHHSTLVIKLPQGKIDFSTGDKSDTVNPYHYQNHYKPEAVEFLKELYAAANEGNHDRSDIRTDYFDVGWYVDVRIGEWDKPYILIK